MLLHLCSVKNLYQSRFLGLAAMASPSRSSQSRRRCKSETRFSSARSTSDTDLVSLQSRSTLTASTSLYCIGQSEDMVICWDIREEVDAGDWIGMYLIDEVLSENFLDYKSRGVSGSHKGQIVWRIDASLYFMEDPPDSDVQLLKLLAICLYFLHDGLLRLMCFLPRSCGIK